MVEELNALQEELTIRLLNRAVSKLIIIQQIQERNMALQDDSNCLPKCRDMVIQFKNTTKEIPNEITRLCMLVDYLLIDSCRCERISSSNLLLAQYGGYVYEYTIFGKTMKFSILDESNAENTQQYCYITFGFPDDPLFYTIKRIEKNEIPKLVTALNDIDDRLYLREIYSKVMEVFDETLMKYVTDGEFRVNEFSLTGIHPRLLPVKPRAKKQKVDEAETSQTSSNELKTRKPLSKIHIILKNWYDASKTEINAASILMTVISKLLTDEHACSSTRKVEGWPYRKYVNECTMFWVPAHDKSGIKVEVGTACPVNEKAIYVAILKNDEEFYVSVRSFDDPKEYAVKKIVKTLIPSFENGEEDDDDLRLLDLRSWVGAVFKKFIIPTLFGPKKSSKSPSIVLSVRHSGDSSPISE